MSGPASSLEAAGAWAFTMIALVAVACAAPSPHSGQWVLLGGLMPHKKQIHCVHTAAGDPRQEPVAISPGPGQLQMWVGGAIFTVFPHLHFLGRQEPAPQGLLGCALGCAHCADEVPAGRGKKPLLLSTDLATAVTFQARSVACSRRACLSPEC